MKREFNSPYEGPYNQYVAFPLGGIGAGMLCLEGTGALSHVSLWNKPDVNYEPSVFAALCVKGGDGNRAVVLEGLVPSHKIFRVPGGGNGLGGKTYGLPRFSECSFTARFPFGTVRLSDESIPLTAELTGWSPFLPGRADDSSLPVAALEYALHNPSGNAVEAVFSFHVPVRMAGPQHSPGEGIITHVPGGFIVEHKPADGDDAAHSWLGVSTDRPEVEVYSQWFRGGWFDPLTMLWKRIESGETAGAEPYREGGGSPGASIFVPLTIAPGGTQTVKVLLCWYAPNSGLNTVKPEEELPGACGCGCACNAQQGTYYKPWYAAKFPDIASVMRHWSEEYGALREETKTFTDCFYASTLPPEVIEAVAANLSILKSPTVLREEGGKLWCWEGCCDDVGCCPGSCTHVWNYAQALPHLFPDLERSLRETEFLCSQDERGHQNFRAALPLRDYAHTFHAAADGQLGGVMKVWREWRISGDEKWLRRLWPRVKQSLEYCIVTWDPDGIGVLTEPHHNTYDIEFWGPDGMCSSFYLGALLAASAIAEALGEDGSRYAALAAKGRKYLEEKLFNGEYFIQEVRRTQRKKPDTAGVEAPEKFLPEARALIEAEGPKYQYGTGCLSDGVLGAWMARVCGIQADLLDAEMVKSHLASVYKYNLKKDLSRHANPQRPGYALGREGGLLLCTWPKGGKPSLPFVYSDEVWTGIEYQAASHMIMAGLIEEGLEVVRTCRSRYDGRVRNPFDEYECGHWYARAMASWALLQALSGASYDAVERRMTLKPRIKGDFQCFIATATGYGLVGVRGGKPFLCVKKGSIPVKEWAYTPQE